MGNHIFCILAFILLLGRSVAWTANWTSWTEWDICNCAGKQVRVRDCYHYHQNKQPNIAYDCPGSDIETQPCTLDETLISSCYPVSAITTKPPGVWNAWSDWTNCTELCGNNNRIRVRHCTNDEYTQLENNCQGHSVESLPCPEINCTSQGIWSPWTEWASCNCAGEQERTRECYHYHPNSPPTPATDCQGHRLETLSCTQDVTLISSCHPVSVMTTKSPDSWNNWSSWTICTATCGEGVKYRSRKCSTYDHIQVYDCIGPSVDTEKCYNNVCVDTVLHLSTLVSIDSMNTTTTPATDTLHPGSESTEQSVTTPASHNMSTGHPSSQHTGLHLSTLYAIVAMNTTTSTPTDTVDPGSDSTHQATTTTTSQNTVLHLSTLASIVAMNTTTTPATGTLHPGSESTEQSVTTPASHNMSTGHPSSQPQTTAGKETTVTTKVTQPQSISCFACLDDPSDCEYTFQKVTCSAPNNYCINDLTNNLDATRSLVRRCGNYDECVNDWWLTYSDNEQCKNFNQDSTFNQDFNCKYCCVKDGCNSRINPPKEMNFVKN